jgi:acetoin utilization deacetylase AcuC-like enzyme
MSDRAVLYVGTFSSHCGVCNREAFPHEKTHAKEAGYHKNRGDGCGVRWTHITSDYAGEGAQALIIEDAVKKMRPDLIYI